MLLRGTVRGQCQFSMLRAFAFASVRRTVVTFSTKAKGASTPTGEPHCEPISSAAQQTVSRSPSVGDHFHDQKLPNSSPNSGSESILCNNKDLNSDPPQSHGPLEINTEKNSIGDSSYDTAPKPWRNVLVRSEKSSIGDTGYDEAPKPWRNIFARCEKKKQDKRKWNKLFKDKGFLSHNWWTPLRALEEHHDRIVEAGKACELKREAPRPKRPLIRQKHAEQIEPQRVWTAFTFMNYVNDLTTSSVDRSVKYDLYGIEGSHPMAVSNVLERLFNEVATKELLSVEACNAAIRYFFKHNQISKAKAIFNKMEHLHQEIQTPTVNILLLAAANQKDLHNFTFILKRMLRWGFEPDEGTWKALLVAVGSKEVRELIVKRMQKRNLLRSLPIVRNVMTTIVQDELIKHLDAGSSLDSFLSFLDIEYGTKWLTVDAANNLFHEVGKRKGVQEVIGLLDSLKTRGLKADMVTLGTLLQICRIYNERFMAIRLLQLFESEYGVVPGEDSYNILFGMAWNNRMYNFLRVIWTFACVEGLTSNYMCQLISRSIKSEEENPPPGVRKNNSKIWKNSAGAVVVGIMSRNASNQNSLSTTVAMTDVQQNGDEAAAEMKERLVQMLDEDLATVRRYQIEESLVELLSSAQALDGEWHSSGAWKAKSVEWKRKNVIRPILMQPQSRPILWRYVSDAEAI